MRFIAVAAVLFLGLVSPARGGGLDDYKAGFNAAIQGNYDRAIELIKSNFEVYLDSLRSVL